MTFVNLAIAFASLSALVLILAAMIDRNEQRNIDLRARGYDDDDNDGENFV